jgi:ATP-binding cassette subfamily B protein
MSVFSPSITLTVNIGIVAVLWLGGLSVSSGNMHVGQIIAYINYMTQILFSLMMISFVFTMFVRARASAERIDEVFKQQNSILNMEYPIKMPDMKGRLDFEGVFFSYTDGASEPVIKNITFTCMPGDYIGIIGPTGSGKSSLVNLIPRFYDVTSGVVRMNGIDVRLLDQNELRERISIVPQKTDLFTGTVMDNIRWGRESADVQEIEAAAAAAEAHDFITSFPEGYDTQLGQGGVNLSGGQKQRIAIARALIRKPEILILDDCTSAVDVATEARIRNALKVYAEGLTCITIAQRITSVLASDKIIVLDNGEMVGFGSHAELMKTNVVYQDIFHSQMGNEVHGYDNEK